MKEENEVLKNKIQEAIKENKDVAPSAKNKNGN